MDLHVAAIELKCLQSMAEIKRAEYSRFRISCINIGFRRWNGDSIVMGDFNDVRCKEERLDSLFNPLGARLFNQFINSSGLVEVKLEGYSFTWSHPSASKMSKLDRFLVTEGPTPFRFYLSWFRLDGFDDMVKQAWESFSHSDSNDPVKVKDTFKDHFQARFKQPSPNRFKLSSPFTKRLSPNQVVDIDSNVSWNEIRRAVWDCGDNKSPGPDGYSFEFFGSTGVLLVQTFVVRLNIFLSMDRSRKDGPFILNELLSWCKKSKKQAMFFKVDFAKAVSNKFTSYKKEILEDPNNPFFGSS
nr:RNA-directed DNA polymerase, eukaryota [Tanacetum cinerariifolium]